jgi:FKBP-type peptidyl-prolyl cis-trans isomerase
MRLKFSLIGLLFISVIFLSSCGKDKPGYWSQDEQNAKDRQLIEDYASANNLSGQFTNSGLYYVIEEPGEAEKPDATAIISVHYKGYYLDGVLLDEGDLTNTYISNLIPGWQEGIRLIGKNGKIKLIIPSVLGYGHTPANGVRADAVLVFDILLKDFTN